MPKEKANVRPKSFNYKKKQSLSYDNYSRSLIYHALGFKENDENFEEVLQYIKSNLLYHTCLDVNRHSVQNSIQGIAFKMSIHGYQEKSDRLLSLAEKFIILLKGQEEESLKWTLLSLLINLGKHPARDNLLSVSAIKIDQEPTLVPSHDEWMQELMERSLHQTDGDETLSNWSDDEDLELSLSQGVDYDWFLKQSKDNNDRPEKTDTVVQRNSDLARSWIANSIIPTYWTQSKRLKILPEYVIMRECLWVLISPHENFVFSKNDSNEFKVQSIALCHLLKESLEKLLEPIASTATYLNGLNIWLKKIVASPECYYPGYGTLKSYAEGINHWKQNFMRFLCKLEKIVIQQEGHQTVLWLLGQLNLHIMDLQIIHEIHQDTIEGQRGESDSSRALNLIGALVVNVGTPMMQTTKNSLLSLLRYALRFHLKALQDILYSSDFISTTKTSFWHKFLTEFGVKLTTTDENELHFKADEETLISKTRGLTFLSAIQHQVVRVCRLKYILGRINKLDEETVCIESIVTNALEIYYYNAKSNDALSSDDQSLETAADEEKSTEDSLLSSKENDNPKSELDDDCPESIVTEELSRITVTTDVGLEKILIKTLEPIVNQRCDKLSTRLFQVLSTEFQLEAQMEIFRRIVVMEAGDIMHSFYTHLFSLIDEREPVDEYMLTNQLQDSVHVSYPNLSNYFNVSFSRPKNESASSKLIMYRQCCETLFSTISIDYQTVYPFSLILNDAVIAKYNQLFRFGLSLKRMTCVMENLTFKDFTRFGDVSFDKTSTEDCDDEPEEVLLPVRLRRLQLLRYWLLHFVRLIHDHFYIVVFMPFSDRFRVLFQKYRGFFELIHEHEILMNDVCKQCLLTHQATFSKILQKIFSVVEEVRSLWLGPVEAITTKKLADLEDRYSTGHRVTVRYLSICNQSLQNPHVASLAESLSTSIPTT